MKIAKILALKILKLLHKNMLLFEKLFDYFWLNEPTVDPNIYTHFYAPENQIILFCLDNNLPILAYRDYCLTRFKHLDL